MHTHKEPTRGNPQAFIQAEEQVNKEQVKQIRAGQTITVEGRETRQGKHYKKPKTLQIQPLAIKTMD